MFPRAAGPLTPARAALWPGCACLFFQSRCPPSPPPPPALRRIASGCHTDLCTYYCLSIRQAILSPLWQTNGAAVTQALRYDYWLGDFRPTHSQFSTAVVRERRSLAWRRWKSAFFHRQKKPKKVFERLPCNFFFLGGLVVVDWFLKISVSSHIIFLSQTVCVNVSLCECACMHVNVCMCCMGSHKFFYHSFASVKRHI